MFDPVKPNPVAPDLVVSGSKAPQLTVTRLRIDWARPDILLPFLALARQCADAAQTSRGFIAGALWAEARLSFWTVTLWQDAASMRAFARGPSHSRAMRHLQRRGAGYSEAAFASGVSPTAQWPEAAEIVTFLQEKAIFYTLPHPSGDHLEKRIRPPKNYNAERLEPRLDTSGAHYDPAL